MSQIFVAREAALDRSVVVKVLAPESTGGASADRFRREIHVLAKLQQDKDRRMTRSSSHVASIPGSTRRRLGKGPLGDDSREPGMRMSIS